MANFGVFIWLLLGEKACIAEKSSSRSQGKTVSPLTVFKTWGTEKFNLWRSNTELRDKAIQILENSDYPKIPICGICGFSLNGEQWDWYFNGGVGCVNRDTCKNYFGVSNGRSRLID